MKAINIDWDTDGEKVSLPSEVELPDSTISEDGQDPADFLSDEYGWCVNSFDIVKS